MGSLDLSNRSADLDVDIEDSDLKKGSLLNYNIIRSERYSEFQQNTPGQHLWRYKR
jgi:hypothetical protein